MKTKTKTDGRRKRNSFPDEMNFFYIFFPFFSSSHFKYYDDDDIFKVNGSTEFILTNMTKYKKFPTFLLYTLSWMGHNFCFSLVLDRKDLNFAESIIKYKWFL